MKFKTALLSFIICISIISSFGQLPRLHIEGRHVYDQNDSLIILRGFNHSRWGEVLPEDATIIKDLGANSVRTVLRWYYWGKFDASNAVNSRESSAPGHIKPDYLVYLDSVITSFSEKEIWTVLFVNSDQGSGANENHFLNNPALEQEFIELWLFLAERYKDVPYIAAFEILAEPRFTKYNREVSHAELGQFYKKVADSINTITNGEIPFVIGPMDHYKAANLTSDYFLEDYPIIYAANMLWPKPYILGEETYGYPSDEINKETLKTYFTQPLHFRETYDVPVWVDQFGASYEAIGFEEYTRDIIHYYDSLELHWSYWNFRSPNSTRGLFTRQPEKTGDYVMNLAPYNLLDSLLTSGKPVITSIVATQNNNEVFYSVIDYELKVHLKSNSSAEIAIHDLRGNLISKFSANQHNNSIPLGNLSLTSGLYIITIKQKDNISRGKFIYR